LGIIFRGALAAQRNQNRKGAIVKKRVLPQTGWGRPKNGFFEGHIRVRDGQWGDLEVRAVQKVFKTTKDCREKKKIKNQEQGAEMGRSVTAEKG